MNRKKFNGRYRIGTTRLRGYDYASVGWYHVVICTAARTCVFGAVRGGIMGLSALGCTAHRFCAAILRHFDRAVVDAFVVMPNHVHALIGLMPRSDGRRRRGARSRASTEPGGSTQAINTFGPLRPGALSTIVHAYKGAVTRWARKNGHDDFAWQPRFYDRVIRNRRELRATRRYVLDNPLKWHRDRNYPDHL